MSDQTNVEYFAMRAAQEHQMSRDATDPRAAIAHSEMAARYLKLAEEFLGMASEDRDAVAPQPPPPSVPPSVP